MTCNCIMCVRIRSIEYKISMLPDEHQEYFTNWIDSMLEVEFDNDYYKAVMNGTWPGAREVLEHALAKCK